MSMNLSRSRASKNVYVSYHLEQERIEKPWTLVHLKVIEHIVFVKQRVFIRDAVGKALI